MVQDLFLARPRCWAGGISSLAQRIKSIAIVMLSLFIAPNLRLTKHREGRRICMNEMLAVYYAVSILALCLTSIQITIHLVKDLCRHMRSSRRKKRITRK